MLNIRAKILKNSKGSFFSSSGALGGIFTIWNPSWLDLISFKEI